MSDYEEAPGARATTLPTDARSTGYLRELRVNWRFLAAATLGFGFGNQLTQYVGSTFTPHLLAEFGWPKSQFALIGMTILVSILVIPLVGRLNDIFGVRRMAAVGIISAPLIYLAYSAMRGNFLYFVFLNVLQLAAVGCTTTAAVYSRLIAERFERARGIALSTAACGPAVVAALAAPMLSRFIDSFGWRAGYRALGLAMALGGGAALLLIPRTDRSKKAIARKRGSARQDYPLILKDRAFQILSAGMLLCNLTLTVQASQLKLVLLDQGMSSAVASLLLSLYAVGILVGRFCCGLALDRFPPHIVATVVLGMPGIGFLIMVPGGNALLAAASGVVLIGLSMGAEMDVAAYLVMRFFRVDIYSTVYGLMAAAAALSGALGSLLLSMMLKAYGTFNVFFLVCAVLTLLGSALFLLLGRFEHAPRALMPCR